jgi:hypothetical protein
MNNDTKCKKLTHLCSCIERYHLQRPFIMSSQVLAPKSTGNSSSNKQYKFVPNTKVDRAVELVKDLEQDQKCDPRTLIKILHQAANTLCSVGKFKQASSMYNKITAINCQLYGMGHPRTICSNTREVVTYNKQIDINNKMRAYLAAKNLKLAEEKLKAKEAKEKEDKKKEKKAAKLAPKQEE